MNRGMSHPISARRIQLITLLALSLGAAPAGALEVEGVAFEDPIQIAGVSVPLEGAGLLRYRLLIKAYVAAFYASRTGASVSPLAAAPRRLEIEYFWALGAEQFAEATRAGIAANVTPEELRRLEPRIREMNALYQDVEPGDRYALTYANGTTELAKNGVPLGAVAGEDFGRAMFAIWLGSSPLSPSLKGELLGREAP